MTAIAGKGQSGFDRLAPASDVHRRIWAGVDTHKDTHTVGVLDEVGRELGTAQFPATGPGYRSMLSWLVTLGIVQVVGIEGTGAYGAGLARFLSDAGIALIEVDRPDRKARRRQGKSDPVDAMSAARAALAGVQVGQPKDRSGPVEALRQLRVARGCLVEHRADLQRRMKTLVVTAPEALRASLRDLDNRRLLAVCAASRPDPAAAGDPTVAARLALRVLARQHAGLTEQITELDKPIAALVKAINPTLLEVNGVGPDVAGQLLVTAGQNAGRLRSEAAFAMLCGVAPIPASSGRTDRHRLNRGGDRAANSALWRIVICRLRHHQPTKDYVAKRTAQGLSKPEIIRCLKRYVAPDIHRVLTAAAAQQQAPVPA